MNTLSGRITLSTTDEVESLYEQLENDIENLYGGKSAFWRSCLMNFDDKSRIKAKVELIEQRIEEKQKEIEDLKLQKKGLESELDEITMEEQEETVEKENDVPPKFWDQTVQKIFERSNRREPAKVENRWDQWFDGRHKLFVNRHYKVTTHEFKEMLLEEAEKRGFSEEVEKLESK